MKRLFIAIELPNEIIDKIDSYINDIKDKIRGKFVPRENLHITLLFLGDTNVPENRILDVLSTEKADFKIDLGGINAFPNLEAPRVIFIEIKTDLRPLYLDLCKKLGVSPLDDFNPHITICRVNRTGNVKATIEKNAFPAGLTFISKNLTLFNSDLKNYSKIET